MDGTFSVHIRGDGVAARSCAHLLTRAGVAPALDGTGRGRVPALLLSAQAMHLLGDIFADKSLFAGLHRIHARRVAWGPGAAAVIVPHEGVVVAEETLLTRLPLPDTANIPAAYTVYAGTPLPEGTLRQRFGARAANGAEVTLRPAADAGACSIESLDAGWLFLIPTSAGEARLFAVGGGVAELLGESRLIAPEIDRVGAQHGPFETAPSIADPVCGANWLACGSAAMTVDPICGDGAATAGREAILAAAVLSAVRRGDAPEPLLVHYGSLLTGAMRRHLALCLDFYASGGRGVWWKEQCDLLRQGHEWCTARLALMPEPRYRLQDFDLVDLETKSPL